LVATDELRASNVMELVGHWPTASRATGSYKAAFVTMH
jgi:hypothetical protein